MVSSPMDFDPTPSSRAAGFWLSAAAAFLLATTVNSYAAPPPIEAYAQLPQIAGASLSPSGRYIGMLKRIGGELGVAVIDTQNGQQVSAIPPGDLKIRGVSWFSDQRLILSVVRTTALRGDEKQQLRDWCRLVGINIDGTGAKTLAADKLELRYNGSTCNILSRRNVGPNKIIVSAYFPAGAAGSGRTSREGAWAARVFKVDVVTGETEDYERGETSTYQWFADSQGQVRGRLDAVGSLASFNPLGGSESRLMVRDSEGGAWYEAFRGRATSIFDGSDSESESGDRDKVSISFVGFGEEPNVMYVETNSGDKAALGAFDVKTKSVRTLLEDAKYDADGFISDRTNRAVIGAWITRWRPEQIFFAPKWKTMIEEIKQAFPGHSVLWSNASDDHQHHIVYVEGPEFPGGSYHYIDMASGNAILVGERHPQVRQAAPVRTMTYAARDGLSIDAYLTVPAGSAAKNLAAVILPHGGPQARDSGDFDSWSQFLASRGYAVFQPQFRGSSGYGAKFAGAGVGEWGGAMQNDLSDGVKHLVAQGVVDPARVCILGWSYGGYAAGAGATLTPELYRCAISGAGVHDLIAMQLWTINAGGGRRGAFSYWRRHIGDPRLEKERLERTSPAKQAASVRAPIMLLHGTQDTIVPIQQSELMAQALTQAGKTFEFVRLEGEDHNLSLERTRLQTMKAWEAFLLKHNPSQ